MAGRFSSDQWDAIEAELEGRPDFYGLPEGGREGSLVLGSFNIRKLGAVRNRQREIAFLARFCTRCDLVAIQEIQDNLDGLQALHREIERQIAAEGEYELLVSDITGRVPGETGMAERLAFLYRHRRVRRAALASDLTVDRTGVLDNLMHTDEDVVGAWKAFRAESAAHEQALKAFERALARFENGDVAKKPKRPTAPKLALKEFLTFTRTPHVVGFEAPAANGEAPLRFIGVNAHLLFGTMAQRTREFQELMSWLINRLKSGSRFAENFVLLGDLNLNFDNPRTDRAKFEAVIRDTNQAVFGDPDMRRVYFPFIDKHPLTDKIVRTTARQKQTFDHIAFFLGDKEKRLPNDLWRDTVAGDQPDGFDYGVFNFADLFARAIEDTPYLRMTKARRAALGKHFEHSVSDHMPIWVRLPRPGFQPPPV